MAGEKRTIGRIINFFKENSFEDLIKEAKSECSNWNGDPMYGGVICDELTPEESLSIPPEKNHTEEIEELNNHFNILINAFTSFVKSICDILLEEGSCLSDEDKNKVDIFFSDYVFSEEVFSISSLLRDIHIDARNMEKLAKLFSSNRKDSAYVLAVKQGLLEEKNGTYTPLFEDGKKGLKNVLERWYALSVEHEIPMPTYNDLSNKLRKTGGEKYKKNYIRNCLQELRNEEMQKKI